MCLCVKVYQAFGQVCHHSLAVTVDFLDKFVGHGYENLGAAGGLDNEKHILGRVVDSRNHTYISECPVSDSESNKVGRV